MAFHGRVAAEQHLDMLTVISATQEPEAGVLVQVLGTTGPIQGWTWPFGEMLSHK